MWLSHIDMSILVLFSLLMLFLLSFGRLVVVHLLIDVPLLLFGLIQLLQHFWSYSLR